MKSSKKSQSSQLAKPKEATSSSDAAKRVDHRYQQKSKARNYRWERRARTCYHQQQYLRANSQQHCSRSHHQQHLRANSFALARAATCTSNVSGLADPSIVSAYRSDCAHGPSLDTCGEEKITEIRPYIDLIRRKSSHKRLDLPYQYNEGKKFPPSKFLNVGIESGQV